MRYSKEDKMAARERLEGLLHDGSKVYTVLRHCSSSGMMRHISLKVIVDGELQDITYAAAALLDRSLAKGGTVAIKESGCGMDMGFHLVYCLSVALFCEDGFDQQKAYWLKQSWL